MPEGDTVHRLARRLAAQLDGRRVTRAEARTSRINPAPIVGLTLINVTAQGKHILMRFDGDKQLTLHSHLRMQGMWRLTKTGSRLPVNTRLALEFDDDIRVVADNVPVLDLIESSRENELVGHVGADILTDDFDVSTAAAGVVGEGGRAIFETLHDQRILSGLGNVWVNEVLFLRGVHPDRPAQDVDAVALLELARKMIRYSRDVVPGMITTGNKRDPRWIYGRGGKPCKRCNTTVEFRRGSTGLKTRDTYWCPSCQPL